MNPQSPTNTDINPNPSADVAAPPVPPTPEPGIAPPPGGPAPLDPTPPPPLSPTPPEPTPGPDLGSFGIPSPQPPTPPTPDSSPFGPSPGTSPADMGGGPVVPPVPTNLSAAESKSKNLKRAVMIGGGLLVLFLFIVVVL